MSLVPAEGPIPYRTFYSYIAERGFPVTQFIRHGSKPEFTPEPDMIHDCLGHVPPLMNHDYAELLTLIGTAAVSVASGDHVLALKRLSWFSVEFGLIEEAGRDANLRRGDPLVGRRDPVLAVLARRAAAVRDRRGDRDRLRPVAHAGSAVRDSVVRVAASGRRAVCPAARGHDSLVAKGAAKGAAEWCGRVVRQDGAVNRCGRVVGQDRSGNRCGQQVRPTGADKRCGRVVRRDRAVTTCAARCADKTVGPVVRTTKMSGFART